MTVQQTLPDQFDPELGTTLVSLTRETLERTVANGTSQPARHSDDHPMLAESRGAFVTIERDGELRGCCGRVTAEQPIGRVVQHVARETARADPRFTPLQPAELEDATLSVTVLSEPTAIAAEDEPIPTAIQVGRHGLFVLSEHSRGLLLPQVATDHDWSAQEFLAAACQKASLEPMAWQRPDVTVAAFTARSFHEETPRGSVTCECYDLDTGCPSAGEIEGRTTIGAAGSDSPSRGTNDGVGTDNSPQTDGDGTNNDPVTDGDGSDNTPLTDGDRFDDDPVTDGGRPETRPPVVAGQFYAGTEPQLRSQIADCFAHEHGPGAIDSLPADGPEPRLVVSPHAGYPFSGPVAAHGFGTLTQRCTPDTVVLLGPNHGGTGAAVAVSPHDRWRTPLGSVPVDTELAKALLAESSIAETDAIAHRGEHSLEVQVPFLQYCFEKIELLPVCLTRLGEDKARQLGREIAATIRGTDRSVVIVSSTDLTHHQPHERAVEADEPILAAIEDGTVEAIADASRHGHTMCGPWATVAGITAAEELGATSGTVLKYATSGDTSGDTSRVVGYCSALRSQ